MTIAELIESRLSGKADYADRVRLGSIVLIVRALDEHEAIAGVGVSLEPVEPATSLPIFISFGEIVRRVRAHVEHRRNARNPQAQKSALPSSTASTDVRENES